MKKVLIGFAALTLLSILFMAAVAVHVAGLGQNQAEAATRLKNRCAAPAGGTDVDTSAVAQQVHAILAGAKSEVNVEGLPDPKEQIPNARVIIATGIQLKIPARGQVIALATALQESGLRNLTYGDRDSIGLFQQRPSQGWGSREQILDPVYSSTKFYKALQAVDGWEKMPLTVAAQTVQASATPDAYAQHERLATALQQAIAPTLGAAPAVPGMAGATGGRVCPGQPDGAGYGTIPAGSLPAGYQIPITAPPAARAAIRWALGQLGTPYQWGGSCTNPHGPSPADHCDCSSLMQRAYGVAGIQLSRTTYDQVNEGRPAPLDALQAGDLVFTEGSAARPEHVALYLGDGLLVHAPRPGRVVEVAKIAGHGVLLAARRVAP
ncbi:C40 family peptidase [Streptomyces sp. NPDC021100]|uniref:C40 family peptidase n=1 Tax=Streptomyces sp. NPDC021100 TaxID=3365114 RepID=UPI0037920DFD